MATHGDNSSRGPWIESAGREGIRYHEGERSVYLWTEFLIPKGIVVSTDGIARWDSPHQNEAISPAEKQRILDNIKSLIEEAGDTVTFES